MTDAPQEYLDQALARVAHLEKVEHDLSATLENLRLHQEELRTQNDELRRTQHDLLAARRRYQDLFDFASVAYFLVDQAGAVIEANHAACDLLCLNRQRMGGYLLPVHANDPAQRTALLRFLSSVARGEPPSPFELDLRNREGKFLRVEVHGSRGDEQGTRIRLGILDISHRAALEEARLRGEEQRRLAATVFEESNEGIIITDPKGRILRVNRAFTLVTGFGEQEVVGLTPAVLASGRHDAAFYQHMWQSLLERSHWQGEIWNKRKSGEIYAEWLGITTIRDAQGEPQFFVAIFSDITEKKQNQLRIEHIAHYDGLTDLPNRSLFNDRLKNALVRAHRNAAHVALLFLDLDRFKAINDTLGHHSGDILLQRVADRLRRAVRSSDTVSRLGGDEFTIILADLEGREQAVESATTVAGKVIAALGRPFHIAGQEVHTGSSVGIALYPGDGETCADLVKHADTALYHAKAAGGGTLSFFSHDMMQAAVRRLTLEGRLRKAVERERLRVVYQPIVDAAGRRLLGLESLLRWHDEELGQVAPMEFVRMLEDIGLIDGVTDWLIDRVCRQIGLWQNQGLSGFYVTVNLSPRSFRRPDCAESIHRPLRLHGIEATRLAVEITESHMMQRPSEAMAILEAVRAAGIRVGMDDFGTGWSSLSLLKRFPIDFIKVDGSFIRDLVDDPGDAALVRAIIAMAHSLDLGLVAEGVETQVHSAVLLEMGCPTMQGFHFARPMPPEALAGWHRQFTGAGGV